MTQVDRRTNWISCKHCGKLGHKETNYFELVGYPANWGTRGGRSGRGRGRGGRGGGRKNSGRGRGVFQPRELAHATQAPDSSSSDDRREGVRAALSKITDEQVQKLLSLIETPKENNERLSGKCDWLLDSGASYHMTGTVSYTHLTLPTKRIV